MKQYATISADVVASTSLGKDDLGRLTQQIKETLGQFSNKYDGFWGRLVHGDSIECVMDNPKDALRIAVLLKAGVKSFVPSNEEGGTEDKKNKKAKEKFKRTGLRLAIGIGSMRNVDRKMDIMDGEAMYLSGRALASMRKKPIDNFRIEVASGVSYDRGMTIIAQHLSRRLDEATSRQCKTLFYRLLSKKDNDVAEIMKISRAGVNSNLIGIGWDLFSTSVSYYEDLFLEAKSDIQSKDSQSSETGKSDSQSNDSQSNESQSNDSGISDSQLNDRDITDSQSNEKPQNDNQMSDSRAADSQTQVIYIVDYKQNSSPILWAPDSDRIKYSDTILNRWISGSKTLAFDGDQDLDRYWESFSCLYFWKKNFYENYHNPGDKEVAFATFTDLLNTRLKDSFKEELAKRFDEAYAEMPLFQSLRGFNGVQKSYFIACFEKNARFKNSVRGKDEFRDKINKVLNGFRVESKRRRQNVDKKLIVFKSQRVETNWKELREQMQTIGICDSRIWNSNDPEMVSFMQPNTNSKLFVVVSYLEEKEDNTIRKNPLSDVRAIFDIMKENMNLSAVFMEKAKLINKGIKKSEDKTKEDRVTKFEYRDTVGLDSINNRDNDTINQNLGKDKKGTLDEETFEVKCVRRKVKDRCNSQGLSSEEIGSQKRGVVKASRVQSIECQGPGVLDAAVNNIRGIESQVDSNVDGFKYRCNDPAFQYY